MVPIVFAILTLFTLLPLPPGSALLVGRTVLKSEDGKYSVQVATFGFPMSQDDSWLLGSTMNSDPYWHHFRMRTVYLQVGDKVFAGGPRLTERSLLGLLPKSEPVSRYRWTTAFVLPAEVRLTGTDLKFSYGDWNSKPAKETFARLELTEKDLKDARPFQARVKATGKFQEPLDDNREVYYVVFVPSHYVLFDSLRIGKAEAHRFPYDIVFGEGKGHRPSLPNELAATFEEAPVSDAVISMRIHGAEGWYKAETIVENAKKK